MGTMMTQIGTYRIVWRDLGTMLERYYATQAIAQALFGWLP